jgi:antitoxin component YwqK of YwqJK toxin-antitoxin module
MRRKKDVNEGEEFTEFHKDGSVCAKGRKLDGELHGYWEWFRKDGTRKRSGSFDRGVQVGEWTTYDAEGDVYKVTTMKRKAGE